MSCRYSSSRSLLHRFLHTWIYHHLILRRVPVSGYTYIPVLSILSMPVQSSSVEFCRLPVRFLEFVFICYIITYLILSIPVHRTYLDASSVECQSIASSVELKFWWPVELILSIASCRWWVRSICQIQVIVIPTPSYLVHRVALPVDHWFRRLILSMPDFDSDELGWFTYVVDFVDASRCQRRVPVLMSWLSTLSTTIDVLDQFLLPDLSHRSFAYHIPSTPSIVHTIDFIPSFFSASFISRFTSSDFVDLPAVLQILILILSSSAVRRVLILTSHTLPDEPVRRFT